ncbi:MAG: hypothetical protein NTW94_06745 [Legionellales bacterium]|nr:hypothetical protein [Legionellales bacterium]
METIQNPNKLKSSFLEAIQAGQVLKIAFYSDVSAQINDKASTINLLFSPKNKLDFIGKRLQKKANILANSTNSLVTTFRKILGMSRKSRDDGKSVEVKRP